MYYNVLTSDGKTFIARLLESKGKAKPPKEIIIQKEGDRLVGSENEDLLHYLNFDIRERFSERDQERAC